MGFTHTEEQLLNQLVKESIDTWAVEHEGVATNSFEFEGGLVVLAEIDHTGLVSLEAVVIQDSVPGEKLTWTEDWPLTVEEIREKVS